jgi:hypothetical protein
VALLSQRREIAHCTQPFVAGQLAYGVGSRYDVVVVVSVRECGRYNTFMKLLYVAGVW